MRHLNRLVDNGLSRGAAALAVVMTTREHSRPESELIDIVRQYQWLESPKDAKDAIRHLKGNGWLTEVISYGTTLVQANKLRTKIADTLGDESVKDALKQIRNVVDPYVSFLGSMNDEDVYLSYLRLLETAHSEICLPMLATTPNLESVPILKERASKGVKVRILLAAPNIVVQLRGETMRETAKQAILGWTAHAASCQNIEVRVTHALLDTYLSTCMLIDGALLRFDVYDPHEQRSLQGEMIEFRSPEGLDLNIIRMFRFWFDSAWTNATPVGLVLQIGWYLQRFWNWWVGGAFLLAALFIKNSAVQGICCSLSAGFFLNGIVEMKDKIREIFKGWCRT